MSFKFFPILQTLERKSVFLREKRKRKKKRVFARFVFKMLLVSFSRLYEVLKPRQDVVVLHYARHKLPVVKSLGVPQQQVFEAHDNAVLHRVGGKFQLGVELLDDFYHHIALLGGHVQGLVYPVVKV